MASGHMNRVKRPDTWLHRPMLQNVKKALANPEPSTQDPKQTQAFAAQNFVMFAAGGFGFFARLALYSSTIFSSGPKTQLYNSPMLCSSCGSDSMLNTLG